MSELPAQSGADAAARICSGKISKPRFETSDGFQENIAKIARLFPSVVTESCDDTGRLRHTVNFERLREVLGEAASEPREAYEFTWVGKKAAALEAGKPIRKTLRPCVAESKNWDNTQNLYIEGDNLEVLKLLQESYLGKVKMIYMDPPYNTGNDFIYRDDFAAKKEDYEAELGIEDEETGERLFKNTETNGRFHSDWCSMIYSRLLVARNLLIDNGMVFASLDDNEITNFRKLADEVFGSEHFLFQVTLLCNPKGRALDKYVANCHEYLIAYSKSVLPKGVLSIPKDAEEVSANYRLKDNRGLYRELELRNTHREFGKHNRANLWYPFYIDVDGIVSLTNASNCSEVFPYWDDGFEGCWTWGKEKAIRQLNEIVARKQKGEWKVYRKNYAFGEDGEATKQVKSIWSEARFHTEKGQSAFNELFDLRGKIFQSPKSVELLKQALLMATDRESIILDFFSGSATTAHAVMQLNAEDGGTRRFIMVQLPEETAPESEAAKAGFKNICEIGKERIRRAGEKIVTELNAKTKKKENGTDLFDETQSNEIKLPDIGFRVLKVDSSNMEEVYYHPEQISQDLLEGLTSHIKPDRSGEDLLFGCLLDWGLPLSLPYLSEQLDGVSVHTYNDGDLVACFDPAVPESVVRAIAQRAPLRAVFYDGSFADSAAKINVVEIFKALSPNTEVKVI